MRLRRDPTMEARVLWVMEEHGEDTLPKLASLCGYSYTQMRRMLNLLVGEGSAYVRQRSGRRLYGRSDV